MKSKASAQWEGSLKEGAGKINSDSGVLAGVPYSFATRFAGAKGTNPEELIAAAHSACFSMAVAAGLGEAGITPKRVSANATVTLDKDKEGSGFSVVSSHLDVVVAAPGANRDTVQKVVEGAKVNCPISKLLKATVTMEAKYEV